MLFHLSLSHGASSSRNLFVCSLKIFPNADEINLLIRIAVALSNGSGRPPSSSKTLLTPSRLLMKLQIWVPSRGFVSVILVLILRDTESTLSLKKGHSSRKWVTSSVPSLQIKQRDLFVPTCHGTPPLSPKLPISLIWMCMWLTRSG